MKKKKFKLAKYFIMKADQSFEKNLKDAVIAFIDNYKLNHNNIAPSSVPTKILGNTIDIPHEWICEADLFGYHITIQPDDRIMPGHLYVE